MSILGLFKKGDSNAAPDIGQEDEYEEKSKKKVVKKVVKKIKEADETPVIKEPIVKSSILKGSVKKGFSVEGEKMKLEFQKVGTRVESLNALISGYGERISMLSQQIGEVRAMNLANEKATGKLGINAAKAIDIVQEVKPDKLRLDYQKADMKVQQLDEKIESNKQFMDVIMTELKEIRSKIGTFIGTEELLKLNDDIKKDLVETHQMSAKSKMQADKTQQLFSEIRRNVAESEKVSAKINNLDANYSGVMKIIEGLNIDFSNIVGKSDFDGFKKNIDSKVILINKGLDDVGKVKDENARLGRVIETVLGVVQENKKDIEEISISTGDENLRVVGNYSNRIDSILEVLNVLAGKIKDIEKKVGIKGKVLTKKVKSSIKEVESVGEKKEVVIPKGLSREISKKVPVKVKKVVAPKDVPQEISKKVPTGGKTVIAPKKRSLFGRFYRGKNIKKESAEIIKNVEESASVGVSSSNDKLEGAKAELGKLNKLKKKAKSIFGKEALERRKASTSKGVSGGIFKKMPKKGVGKVIIKKVVKNPKVVTAKVVPRKIPKKMPVKSKKKKVKKSEVKRKKKVKKKNVTPKSVPRDIPKKVPIKSKKKVKRKVHKENHTKAQIKKIRLRSLEKARAVRKKNLKKQRNIEIKKEREIIKVEREKLNALRAKGKK